ncbi:hypothetical protein Btru_067827 [Bulinus truncatus]|nr:hypothetical protein Btru_067827 [Bulinus truncatus]
MEKNEPISSYFDFNDATFQAESNFVDEIPIKQTKVKKMKRFDEQNGKEVTRVKPTNKKETTELNNSADFNIFRKSQNLSMNYDTNVRMNLNEILQEMSQGWQEIFSNFAQSLNAMETYEDDCLKYVKGLAHHSKALLQKLTMQKEMICSRLEEMREALKTTP